MSKIILHLPDVRFRGERVQQVLESERVSRG